MENSIFRLIFGRNPGKDSDDAETLHVKALEKALHTTTPESAGTPIQYDRAELGGKDTDESEWW